MSKVAAILGLSLLTACATAQNPNLRPVKVVTELAKTGIHVAKGVADIDQRLKASKIKLRASKKVIEERYRKNPVTSKTIAEGPQPDYNDFVSFPKPAPAEIPHDHVDYAPPAAVHVDGKPIWLQWLLAIAPVFVAGLLLFGGHRKP